NFHSNLKLLFLSNQCNLNLQHNCNLTLSNKFSLNFKLRCCRSLRLCSLTRWNSYNLKPSLNLWLNLNLNPKPNHSPQRRQLEHLKYTFKFCALHLANPFAFRLAHRFWITNIKKPFITFLSLHFNNEKDACWTD